MSRSPGNPIYVHMCIYKHDHLRSRIIIYGWWRIDHGRMRPCKVPLQTYEHHLKMWSTKLAATLSHCHKTNYHSHSCTRQRISIPCTRTQLNFCKHSFIASWIHWMSISTIINMLGCTRTHGMDHHRTLFSFSHYERIHADNLKGAIC